MGVRLAGRAFCQVCGESVNAYVRDGDRGFRPRAVKHGAAGAAAGDGVDCPGSHAFARPRGYDYYRGAWLKRDDRLASAPPAPAPIAIDSLRVALKTLERRLTSAELSDARQLAAAIASLRAILAHPVGVVGVLMAADAILEDAVRWAERPLDRAVRKPT